MTPEEARDRHTAVEPYWLVCRVEDGCREPESVWTDEKAARAYAESLSGAVEVLPVPLILPWPTDGSEDFQFNYNGFTGGWCRIDGCNLLKNHAYRFHANGKREWPVADDWAGDLRSYGFEVWRVDPHDHTTWESPGLGIVIDDPRQ